MAGRRHINRDFYAATLPERRQEARGKRQKAKGERHEAMGFIVAIADGVSADCMGCEAAQTTVTSLVLTITAIQGLGTPRWRLTASLVRKMPG